MKEFITIKNNTQYEIIEKKSRFIANVFYVENIKQVEENLKNIKKENFSARHNCFAYRILNDNQIIEKSSDDGEPSGTAGSPMLNILKKNNLLNILVVVTRYFGGILLGTGGLVRAYSESLQKAISSANIVKKCIGDELKVILNYSEFENFKYYCKKNDINIVKVEYLENIICNIELEMQKTIKIFEDYKSKKIILESIEHMCKKYIEKMQ